MWGAYVFVLYVVLSTRVIRFRDLHLDTLLVFGMVSFTILSNLKIAQGTVSYLSLDYASNIYCCR